MDIFKFITDHAFLVAIAVTSGGMLVWPLLREKKGGNELSTIEATQLINREDALLLDIRDAAAYANGHILNARNIPMAQLEERSDELGKQKGRKRPVIVHCDSGARSGAASAVLAKHGFEQVYSLAGGINAWKAAGLPIEK